MFPALTSTGFGRVKPGKVITFYSFKGGTGRTMAMVNIACLLAERIADTPAKILLVDWDLEAPGLMEFFPGVRNDPETREVPGVIEYFRDLRKRLETDSGFTETLNAEEGAAALAEAFPLDSFVVKNVHGRLDIMPSGKPDDAYAQKIAGFNWMNFHKTFSHAIPRFQEALTETYDYVLIDSRTGYTDTSGICTMLLPEKLVGVFTPNRQNLNGLVKALEKAVSFRRYSNDFRPLSVFPLPSRIEDEEQDLRKRWRTDYQNRLETLFTRLYELDDCNLADYFDEVQIPHRSAYAYGEKIAVLEERDELLSLHRPYRLFFDRLVGLDYAWQHFSEGVSTAGKSKRVYIAHTLEDRELARIVYVNLKSAGIINAWLPEEHVRPGQNWKREIARAIGDSAVVLALLSKHAENSDWLAFEIEKATEVQKASPGFGLLIPVLLDENAYSHPLVKEIRAVPLFPDYERGIREIIGAVKDAVTPKPAKKRAFLKGGIHTKRKK